PRLRALRRTASLAGYPLRTFGARPRLRALRRTASLAGYHLCAPSVRDRGYVRCFAPHPWLATFCRAFGALLATLPAHPRCPNTTAVGGTFKSNLRRSLLPSESPDSSGGLFTA